MTTEIDLHRASLILAKNNEGFLANSLLASQLQADHFNLEKIWSLAMGYLKTENYDSALTCFLQLTQGTNSFKNNYYLALTLEKQGKWNLAKESYLDALLLPTTDYYLLFEAYKNLGNLYLKEKNIDLAEDFYHKAYGLNPENPQLLVNLGTLEIQRNDLSKAVDRFRMALTINSRFSPAWVGLAICYYDFGDLEMAWASVLKSIECDSKNSTALLLLAQWSTKQNATITALKYLMRYFDQGYFEPSLSLAFIELCIQSQKFQLARLELERALLWDPTHLDLLSFDKALANHGH